MTATVTPIAAAPSVDPATAALFTTEHPRGFFPPSLVGGPDETLWTPGVPPCPGDPADEGVVTKLVKPLPVDDLTSLVGVLERVHGTGLVFDSRHRDADLFLVVRHGDTAGSDA